MSITRIIESPKSTKETLDTPKAEPSQRKRVRFNGRVKRRFFDVVEEEDRENVWYSSEDYKEARQFEDALRECVSTNKELYRKNTENLNAQGVLTQEQATKKYALIDASIDAVMDELEGQESAFYDDNSMSGELFCPNDERIAEVYHCHSYEALQQAQSRANRHARHVQKNANKPADKSSALSPSRFARKSPSRLSPRSKKSMILRQGRQLPGPSVFVPEGSSQELRCSA